MKLYVNVQGGTGLNFGLSSFISYIRNNGDLNGITDYEFYVCSPYYDIFKSNPDVTEVYQPNELKDLVLDCKENNGKLFLGRLYDLQEFIYKEFNYSQAWAKIFGIPFKDTEKGTMVKSVLNPTTVYPNLIPIIENVQKSIKEKGFEEYAIMQFTGGQSPLVQVPPKVNEQGQAINEPDWSKVPYNYEQEPLKRHYPIDKVQKFVELYHKKYPKRAIILYQLPNEPKPIGDYIFTGVMPYLVYYELAKEAKQIVAIDSSLQHMTAGLTDSVIIWGHSKPEHFGYSYNKNIEQPCRTDDLFYFTALGPCGSKVNYITPEKLIEEV